MWKPIDTAPKNGEPVLVCSSQFGNYMPEAAYYGQNPNRYNKNIGWITIDGYFNTYPDFWMPLPEPPGNNN